MRLIARFAKNQNEVIDVWDERVERHSLDPTTPTIHSIAKKHPSAVWFERKMHDEFGIEIDGAFDNRPLLRHEHFPHIHPMIQECKELTPAPFHPYPYERIKGEGVFEVGVGPIHAGIIEPGHFHFSQEGEAILHLEVRHFYKYRGIERMCEGKSIEEALRIVEKISGNESIAYQIAFLRPFIEDEEIRKYHAILLELERLIHHLTDLGFIPNDAGFGAALAFCSIKAEECRRMMANITGHRFGFGGVRAEAKPIDKKGLENFLNTLQSDLIWFQEWITDIPSLWDRLDGTGVLQKQEALRYGCVGIVARASGIAIDRRMSDPLYKNFTPPTQQRGDVAARFLQRLDECFASIDLIRSFLDYRPTKSELDVSDGEYFSFSESSIGELFLYTYVENGKIVRFFARDPSFVNWQALHLMMPGNIIADFPLINKSCDLSYAGSDL